MEKGDARGLRGSEIGWGCHCGHTALMIGVEFYPWLVQWRMWELAHTQLLSAQVVLHSPVIGNQSLAAMITAIKTINALHSGNIFYLLGF